jgi:hypothetical protein
MQLRHMVVPGVEINLFENVIEDCKGKLSAGFTVNMPGNYVPKYGAFPQKAKEIV